MADTPEVLELGSYEYFSNFSQYSHKPNSAPSSAKLSLWQRILGSRMLRQSAESAYEAPSYLIEKQFPEGLHSFLIENQTVETGLPRSARKLIGFNSGQFRTRALLPKSMLDIHAHLIDDKLTIRRSHNGNGLYSLTIVPGRNAPVDITASVGNRQLSSDPVLVLKVAERVARDLAFVLRPIALARHDDPFWRHAEEEVEASEGSVEVISSRRRS